MRSAENVELALIVNLEYANKLNWLIRSVEESSKNAQNLTNRQVE